MMSSRRKIILGVVTVLVVIFIALQVIPGYARTNPPVRYHVQWNSPETEDLMRKACYDCHTNETVWPWYSQIAPVSWLVVKDVNEGRSALNLSDGTGEIEAEEFIGEIEEGEMPPRSYLMLHPEANLSAEQKAVLINGIQSTSFAEIGGEYGQENEQGESGEQNEDADG